MLKIAACQFFPLHCELLPRPHKKPDGTKKWKKENHNKPEQSVGMTLELPIVGRNHSHELVQPKQAGTNQCTVEEGNQKSVHVCVALRKRGVLSRQPGRRGAKAGTDSVTPLKRSVRRNAWLGPRVKIEHVRRNERDGSGRGLEVDDFHAQPFPLTMAYVENGQMARRPGKAIFELKALWIGKAEATQFIPALRREIQVGAQEVATVAVEPNDVEVGGPLDDGMKRAVAESVPHVEANDERLRGRPNSRWPGTGRAAQTRQHCLSAATLGHACAATAESLSFGPEKNRIEEPTKSNIAKFVNAYTGALDA